MLNRHALIRPRLTASQLLLLTAAWLVAAQNLSFWREVLATLPQARGVQEWVFIGLLYLVVNAALLLCLGLLTPRPILKPVLTLLLLVAAVCSYFMDTYGVVVDEPMMVNVVQTNVRESSELMVAACWWHLLLFGLLPAMFVCSVRVISAGIVREILRRFLLLAAALVVLVACIGFNYKDFSLWARQNHQIRVHLNPSYPIYSLAKLAGDSLGSVQAVVAAPILVGASRAAQASDRPYLVVMVVGETARAANFQLDGYARATNPELAATPGLINFGQTVSCGTSTAISVPCMFSNLGRADFSKDRAEQRENILDVLKRLSVDVLWLDNNSGCKGVCSRVAYEDLSTQSSPELCNSDGCYDDVLLQNLPSRLPQAGQSRLIVMHQKGSHGPSYYRRYPKGFERFVPACDQDAVQTCSQQQIVNAYDNSILYTDHNLASLIAQLRARQEQIDSVVLYLSDHGESLGENGVYLHGLPYAIAPMEQKHIPFMAWFSSHAAERNGIDPTCLKAASDRPHSHDDLFDTLLGLFQVQAPGYQAPANVFGPCTAAR